MGAQTEQDVLPIVGQCLEGIQRCTDSINEKEGSALVIEKFKSGFLPPGDIPFEDLSSLDNMSGSINPGTLQGTPSEKKTSILGTITGVKIKKRSGLLGIFGQNKVHIIQIYSDSISLLNISNAFDYLS